VERNSTSELEHRFTGCTSDGDALIGVLLYAKYPLSSYDVAEIMLFNVIEISHAKVVASYLAPELSTKAIKKALKRAKVEANFSPDIVVNDDYPAYDRGVKILGRRTKHIHAHFEGKFISYGKSVILLSNNKIERYHSRIAPKIRSMRGVKNLEKEDSFF